MEHTSDAQSDNAISIRLQDLKKAYIEAFPDIYAIAAQNADGSSYMDSLGHLMGIVDNLAMASQAMLHRDYDIGSIFFHDLIDEAESIFQKANLAILHLYELRMNEAHSSTQIR